MSQTRRKGIEILRDEISSIIAVVKSHSDAVTRRLERVREMTTKYCSGAKDSLAAVASAPSLAPTFAPSGALNTIPEGNENTESENNGIAAAAAPSLRQKSKGPVNWSTFRTKVGEGTDLKTGQQSTLDRISTLWKQAKEGKPVGEIEKYLRNELKINAAVAAQKAPELEMIARSYANRSASTLRQPASRVTRRLPSVGGVTSAAPAAAAPRSKKPKAEPPPQENDAAFWERMEREANKNYKDKTAAALALPEQRARVRGEVEARNALKATPLKNRQVPLASIPTLVPQPTVRNQTALNSALGGRLNEELDL